MRLAYDPTLVRALARDTATAIDSLAAIRSHDPAAAFAIEIVRATGRHLEHDWMPLLNDIVTSTAMTEWWQQYAASRRWKPSWATQHQQPFDTRPNRYESMSDQDLLRLVYADGITHGTGPGWSAPDFASSFWTGLPELAAELARRSARPDFAEQLVADIHLLPLVAMSVPLAEFDSAVVTQLTVGLLSGPPIESGMTHRLHGDALEAVMRHLVINSPGGAHEVLANPAALHTLASWERLDQMLVRDFVRVGLYDSVATGARTFDEGIDVIAALVELTNGPFDGGLGAGLANGAADSMFGYAHSIAHGISSLDGSAPVVATDDLGEAGRHLGTVADLRDLFGVMLRHDEARATLATVLGAYIDETVDRLGPRITSTSAADDPINFGRLLDAAIAEESIEIDIAEAADRARRQQLGKTIGFGLGLGLGVLGVPSLVGNVAKEVANRSKLGSTGRTQITERPVGPSAHQGLLLSVLSDAIERPDRRAEYGLGELSDDEWYELRRHIAVVDAADGAARHEAVHNLRNHIERELPAVDQMLVDVSTMAGMDHLSAGSAGVEAD